MTALRATAALSLLLTVQAVCGDASTNAAGLDVQDLLFLAPRQPLLIRLQIEINGKPFRAMGRDLAAERFAEWDTNHDGQLSREELDQTMDRKNIFAATFGQDVAHAPLIERLATGLIDQPFFVDHAEQMLIRPFRIEFEYDSGRSDGALWDLLDRDHNQALSRDEMRQANASLVERDFDDDGQISRLDLMTSPNGALGSHSGMGPFQVIEPGGVERPNAGVAAILLARYDANHDERLSVADVGAPAARKHAEIQMPGMLWKSLDADADGSLSASELKSFDARPADFVLGFSLGRPGSTDKVFTPDDRLRQKLDGSYVLTLPEGVITIRRNNRNPGEAMRDRTLSSLDGDNNDYLEEKELTGTDLAGEFALLDANADGKVTRPEFKSFMDVRGQGGSARLVFKVAHGGRRLFDVFDKNLDGALGPREMQNTKMLFAKYDLNRDDQIDAAELPEHYECEIGRDYKGTETTTMAGRPQPRRVRGDATSAEGPTWFQRMDRNRDGDVSRREFLGPLSKFQELDSDHDDLLTAKEAATAK